MRCLKVNIRDDNALENNQSFPVNLTTSNSDVILRQALTTVYIIDDDGIVEKLGDPYSYG